MILVINKKLNKNKGQSFIWYDPFFQESVTLDCEGYTIKTKYTPYCIFNDKPIKIDKAITLFKEHNNINYSDESIISLMKGSNLVFYEYIQEPEVYNSNKNNDFSDIDANNLSRILKNLEIEFVILNQNNEGITIEIEENDRVEDSIEDFLKEISLKYKYRES